MGRPALGPLPQNPSLLLAGPGPAPQIPHFYRSFDYILRDLGRETGPRGEKMAVVFMGVDSQDLATILYPFEAIFVDLGPDGLPET